jgi:GNAT superfamily N-acetyltransferase
MAILTNLLAHPELRPATEELIARVFPVGKPLDAPLPLSTEFPLLLADSNSERTLVLRDEDSPDRALASASYRVFDFGPLNSPELLRVAGIGLVVTDPAARGRGYAAHLLGACEARSKREGAAMSVLWSDLASFYEKNGYLAGGVEASWVLEGDSLALARTRLKAELPTAAAFDVVAVSGPRSEALRVSLRRLYQESGVGPHRDFGSYVAFETLPRMEQWVARKADGTLAGAALVGKGRDLPDVLHEWTGEARSWPWILRAVLDGGRGRLRVQLPWNLRHREEVEHWLGPAERVPLAFWKILDLPRAAKWIAHEAALPSGVEIRAAATSFEMDGLAPELRDALAGARLPVCPYFWGLDSV